MQQCLRSLPFVSCFLLASCASDQPVASHGAIEIQNDAIIGGATSNTCAWPTTVRVGSGCSGTLIHPNIVVTAAHCFGGSLSAQISFGEKTPFAFSVTSTKCVVGASTGNGTNGSDWAYCVLPDDERIKALPLAPVLHGCEYQKFLAKGSKVWAVGFGRTNGGPGGSGIKSEVELDVNEVTESYINVGEVKHGLCFGDSGGGLYVHLQDGDNDWGWRVFGTVTGPDEEAGPCAGGTIITSILGHIKAIEENENIDVTPCTNALGEWEAGPECTDMATNINALGGQWPGCGAATRSPRVESCL